jgi:hypothetical protein
VKEQLISALTIIRKATDKELVALLARARKEPGPAAATIAEAIKSEMGMRAAATYAKRHYH